jgi:succinoglycan biosynthesis transport protein ExoP
MDRSPPKVSITKREHRSVLAGLEARAHLAPVNATEYESLSGLLRVLRRRWRSVALVAAVVVLLGTAACLLMTPRYSATATIEVNREDHEGASGPRSDNSSDTADDLKAEVQTDTSILQSDGLALRVIKDLNLAKKRPFSSAIARGEADKPLEDAPRTRERMVKLFRKNLKVDSPPDTRLINVTVENPDPTLAALAANSLANTFIDDYLERRHRSTSQASYWLQKELDDLKKQVRDSEQRLADYERTTGLAGVQVSGTTSGDGTSSVSVNSHNTVLDRLFTLNQEMTSAEANRISSEAVYHLVKTQNPEVVLGLGSMSIASGNGSSSGALTADGGVDLLRSLRAQEASLRREYASYATKYGEKNPRLLQLQEQINAVDAQMQTEMARITKRADNAYQYAKENENSIKEQFEKQQHEAIQLADNTVQLQVLAQEAYSNRALYQNLFSKLQEASLSSGVRATRIDVVNEARPAGTPSSPDYPKYLTLVAGIGIFLGISSAFVRESLDESIRTPLDIEAASHLSMLAYIPTKSSAETLAAGTTGECALIVNPYSPFSESFRTLRTSILHSSGTTRLKTLLVTSPHGGDGKTTVAYNLAVAFAQQGSRVILLDADLRNPDLHRLFGCEKSPGLGDVSPAGSHIEVDGLVQHSSIKTLYILPAGNRPELPSEFFSSATFDEVLEMCANRFDYVVIDSPPILRVTDAAIIAKKVDGIITVLRSQATTKSMVSSVAQILVRTNVPALGFVLNGVHNPSLDGFHDYSYLREKGSETHANA